MQEVKVKITVNELFDVVEKFLKVCKKNKMNDKWVHITLNREGLCFSIDDKIKECLNIEQSENYDLLLIERLDRIKKLSKYLKELKKYNTENVILKINNGDWRIEIA
jgi:hypothetical protein